VLFNHDLPWNPMDLEQRIGRIHRYGQVYTAQVYNLVSADTIEGQIYLLLEGKLLEIAKTLGKVDEFGQVAEDLRGQILGQLSERLSYDRLYQDGVRDPRLVRTRQELEVAIDNARVAREIVWELFQDLEGFRLDEYKKMDDGGEGMARLIRYFHSALARKGGKCLQVSNTRFQVLSDGELPVQITTDREEAKVDEHISLLGLEHPIIRQLMDEDRSLEGNARALTATGGHTKGAITVWHVSLQDSAQRFVQRIIPIGLDAQGARSKPIELLAASFNNLSASSESVMTPHTRTELVSKTIPDMLRRDLIHKGLLSESVTVSWRLLAWIELN
jgi:hypothetical protein